MSINLSPGASVFTSVEWGPCNSPVGELSSALRQYKGEVPVVSRHGGGLGSWAVRGYLTQLLAAQHKGGSGRLPTQLWPGAVMKAVRARRAGVHSHTERWGAFPGPGLGTELVRAEPGNNVPLGSEQVPRPTPAGQKVRWSGPKCQGYREAPAGRGIL